MSAILAGALRDGARVARGLLSPLARPPAPETEDAGRSEVEEVFKRRVLEARLQAAIDETLEYHRTHRPRNTTRNYAPKQEEWKAWCQRQGFAPGGTYLPGDLVEESKLLLFMKEEVISRPPRRGRRLEEEKKRKMRVKEERASKRRKPAEGDTAIDEPSNGGDDLIVEGEDDDECSDVVLMYNTIRGYVSAINELWSFQTSQGLHNAPQPHRVAIKALETSIIRGEHQRRREEFVDRGVATILDGYVASQIPDLNRQVWREALGRRVAEQAFRTQLDFLLGNSMLLRLSNRLKLELADFFLMPLPKEGPKGDSWCCVAVMDQGKTNQHGRIEYGAALRHRDYRSCLIGALATYLFWRWHLSGEPFPCFRTSQDWYRIRILKRDNVNLKESLSDSTASSWTKRLYTLSGIKGSKVTHMPRSSGARIAETNNVPEAQVSVISYRMFQPILRYLIQFSLILLSI